MRPLSSGTPAKPPSARRERDALKLNLEGLPEEIGRVLRDIRRARRMTLRQVAEASDGEIKATSLAGYERAERTISLVRFYSICWFFGVAPDRLLTLILARTHPQQPVTPGHLVVDLNRLSQPGSRESRSVEAYVTSVREARGLGGSIISLRTDDLEILATETGKLPESLLHSLSPAAKLAADRPSEPGPEPTP